MRESEKKLEKILIYLYGEEQSRSVLQRLKALVSRARESVGASPGNERFSSTDSVLITYADMVTRPGEKPLETLASFLRDHLSGVVNTIHLLPFFPYSSDDGFSVLDYQRVDPHLGSWSEVEEIGRDFRLMVDAVINHISAGSDWFQAYLRGEQPFEDAFIEIDEGMDLERVFRPRALPLWKQVETSRGMRKVWTTFSSDQVDLNYRSPQVLLAVVAVLLEYVRRGADVIRLDAVAYLWKESGTTCIHLPQTHTIIKLLRLVLEMAAPGTLIITETNVPHKENISYFGKGDEAHMVYNFSLPPLVLHSFASGSAGELTRWADDLEAPVENVSYFNFLASHDGIGLTPAAGILTGKQIQVLIDRAIKLGGYVSEKSNPDGSRTPYELNINFLDALRDPQEPHEQDEILIRRFLASQAIMLSLKGVPGIYFHSLFGSRNWVEGVERSGHSRAINRQKLHWSELEQELADPDSFRSRVYRPYRSMLEIRRLHPAFHPLSDQKVLELNPAVFAVLRSAAEQNSCILCVHNVSGDKQEILLHRSMVPIDGEIVANNLLEDASTGVLEDPFRMRLDPYEAAWMLIKHRD